MESLSEFGLLGGQRGKDDRKQNTLTPLCVLDEIVGSNVITKSSLGRYVFGSEISYNKAPPPLPGLAC